MYFFIMLTFKNIIWYYYNMKNLKPFLEINDVKLTHTEKNIAEFLKKNLNKLLFLNLEDISKETNCSKSSIVRVSNKLGFNGFSGLKREYKSHFLNQDIVLEKYYIKNIMKLICIKNDYKLVSDFISQSKKMLIIADKDLHEISKNFLHLLKFKKIKADNIDSKNFLINPENKNYKKYDLIFYIRSNVVPENIIKLKGLINNNNNISIVIRPEVLNDELNKSFNLELLTPSLEHEQFEKMLIGSILYFIVINNIIHNIK